MPLPFSCAGARGVDHSRYCATYKESSSRLVAEPLGCGPGLPPPHFYARRSSGESGPLSTNSASVGAFSACHRNASTCYYRMTTRTNLH
jgi:hypothetical protein